MSSKKRFTLRITRSAIAFIFGCLALIFISTQLSDAQPLKQLPEFTGHYIAAISDGDFLASTHADGNLPAPGVSDCLSIENDLFQPH